MNSVKRTGHSKAVCRGAHRPFGSTVHAVGQCKPRDYLCEVEKGLVLGRDLSLGPVDGAPRGVRNAVTQRTSYFCYLLFKKVPYYTYFFRHLFFSPHFRGAASHH